MTQFRNRVMTHKIYIRFFEIVGKEAVPLHELDTEDGVFFPDVGDIILDDSSGSEEFFEVIERHYHVAGKRMAVIVKRTKSRLPFGDPQPSKMTRAKIAGF